MATKTYALSKGGHVYTMHPYRGDKIPGCRWKYIGFKDGQRWGAFVSKKEFEAAVDREPDFIAAPEFSEHYVNVLHAEMLSTWKGGELLDNIVKACKKQKASHDKQDLENLDGKGTSQAGGTLLSGSDGGRDRQGAEPN